MTDYGWDFSWDSHTYPQVVISAIYVIFHADKIRP